MAKLLVVDYSEKAVAVFGDTKQFKEELKGALGRFNPLLTNPDSKEVQAGWVFSKKKIEELKQALSTLKDVEIENRL